MLLIKNITLPIISNGPYSNPNVNVDDDSTPPLIPAPKQNETIRAMLTSMSL